MRKDLIARGVAALAVASALAVPAVFGTSVAVAQDGPPPMPANCEVIAQGLMNPRGLVVAEDGTTYVIEAGSGGDEEVFAIAGEGTPAPAESLTTRGLTGQVTKIAADGTVTVLASGLPSYVFGTEIVGPSGGALVGDILYVSVGGPGPATPAIEPIPNQNAVVAIDINTGEITTVADINTLELEQNPDGFGIDSNVNGIAAGDGVLYVADAGGNAIYTVDIASGEVALFAVIPGIPMPGFANDARGGGAEIDPVPTSIHVNDDGSLLVGVLSGGPFPPGAAGYFTVAADGTVGELTQGLTMVMAIDKDADGNVIATSFAADLVSGNPFGSVTRINADGSQTAVVPALFLGAGLDFGADGSLYTLAFSSVEPGAPASGAALKCDTSDEAVAAANEAAAAMAGGGEATPEAEAGAPTSFSIEAIDIAFDTKAFEIAANTDVAITITNNGVSVHDFMIEGTDIDSGYINGGASATVTVNLAPGEYTFFCSVPGHRAAGMVGTITVK